MTAGVFKDLVQIDWPLRLCPALAAVALFVATTVCTIAQEAEPPTSPRDLFNVGTRHLQAGKLREAELYLEMALNTQAQRFYPKALYNLGHVRFRQGAEELKKAPAADTTLEKGQIASNSAEGAIRAAEESLKSGDLQRMLSSYMRGRGSRRELKAALKAVKAAIDAHGKTLNRWQRASGDFHSVIETSSANPDARHNAEVVDRTIAKLIDSIQELEQMAMALGQQNEDLKEQMQKLRGQIPKPDMPPGAAGDEEEDEEEMPKEPEKGQKEAPSKPGEELPRGLSPEQAGWILDGFKLDEGRLPMGQRDKPRERKGEDW